MCHYCGILLHSKWPLTGWWTANRKEQNRWPNWDEWLVIGRMHLRYGRCKVQLWPTFYSLLTKLVQKILLSTRTRTHAPTFTFYESIHIAGIFGMNNYQSWSPPNLLVVVVVCLVLLFECAPEFQQMPFAICSWHGMPCKYAEWYMRKCYRNCEP